MRLFRDDSPVRRPCIRGRICLWLLLAAPAAGGPLQAARSAAALPAPPALRVCADPNDLPYSNARAEGFENRLALLIAGDLGLRVEFVWRDQRGGSARNTLTAGLCDALLGVRSGSGEGLETTRPYYRSTYVFVTRAGARRARAMKAPLRLVSDRPGPPSAGEPGPRAGLAIEAVDRGDVDVAVAWSPLAGWFARRARHPLALSPVPPPDGPFPFAFDVSIGVRKEDAALRDKLDAALTRRAVEVRALLEEYGIPAF